MAASQYGTNYSRFLNAPSSPTDPFPNPVNDGQRVQNARARASAAGVDIGSGYLNPQTGELQDPDRGFGRAVLSRPEIMMPLVLGGGLTAGALMGPAAAAASLPGGMTIPASIAAPPFTVAAPPAIAAAGSTALLPALGGLSEVLPSAAVPGWSSAFGSAYVPASVGGSQALSAGVPWLASAAPKVADLVKNNTDNKDAPNLLGGISPADWIKLGAAGVDRVLSYLASAGASADQLAAAREALDFTKKAYEEQNAKEQARYEATEARRVPYRQASLEALEALKRVIGIPL